MLSDAELSSSVVRAQLQLIKLLFAVATYEVVFLQCAVVVMPRFKNVFQPRLFTFVSDPRHQRVHWTKMTGNRPPAFSIGLIRFRIIAEL